LKKVIDVEIQGERYEMKPNFAALLELETRSDKALHVIAQEGVSGKIRYIDAIAAIYAGLIGAGIRKWSFEKLGEIIRDEGLNKFLPPAGQVIGELMRSGADSEEAKKKEAAPS
jgi:hypothetical protein